MEFERNPGSFRDPNGFIFEHEGIILRQVNRQYEDNLVKLRETGLEKQLSQSGQLIQTEEFQGLPLAEEAFCYLRPTAVPFISYPYEWSFSQLKDAALLTLSIQEQSLAKGLSLKDSSAYNIQFVDGKPVLIDSLSFEAYREGQPWIGYRQFCRHFLAPLALMALVDVRLGSLLRHYIDGIPIDLASRLLPGMTKLKPGLMMHIHAHSKAESHSAGEGGRSLQMSKTAVLGLVDSLKSTVESLHWTPAGTEWGSYYEETNYSDSSMQAKKQLVSQAIALLVPNVNSCWDLGANTGEFSRLASVEGIPTVAWDIDPAAVEKNYLQVKKEGGENLLPLIQDLTNPSSDLGWDLQERSGLLSRGPADLVLGLALIHHLAIGNNVPLPMIASFFRRAGRHLIVEFVPKEDSQVKRMLSHREDIFVDYDLGHWRRACADHFEVLEEWPIEGTVRTLLVLKGREFGAA